MRDRGIKLSTEGKILLKRLGGLLNLSDLVINFFVVMIVQANKIVLDSLSSSRRMRLTV